MSSIYNYYLSIDCANKSLAIGLYGIIKNFNYEIKNNTDYDKYIKIYFLCVFDLLENKKLNESNNIERTQKLKTTLNEIIIKVKDIIDNNDYTLLIEYQMNINDKSRCVYNQIIYEFSDKCKIVTMKPSEKNKIYLHKELSYGEVMNISNSNYVCNKNHSKYNFIYFLFCFGNLHLLKNIKQKNIDDISDTFTQMLAFVLRQKL